MASASINDSAKPISHVPDDKESTADDSGVGAVSHDKPGEKAVNGLDATVVQPDGKPTVNSVDVPKATETAGLDASQAQVNTASKLTSDTKDNDSSHAANGTINVDEKADDQPVNPATLASAEDSQPKLGKLSRPMQRDEKLLQVYINKAHKQVRNGTTVLSAPEDQEQDIIKYAEMVSNMQHLLACAGIGRNTTVRALAYLNGPEQPTPAQAVRQAKQDRRERNDRKRVPSNGSNKNDTKAEENAESNSTTATTSVKTPTLNGSDDVSLDKETISDTKPSVENQKPEAINGNAAADNSAKPKGQKKNGFSRPKWWSNKGRRRTSGNNKKNDTKDATAKTEKPAEKSSKIERDAIVGTPNIDVSVAAPIA